MDGNIPPRDILILWDSLGFDFDFDKTMAAYTEEGRIAMAEYRARQSRTPSEEERFEARAAFGAGVEVVDIISGRSYTT